MSNIVNINIFMPNLHLVQSILKIVLLNSFLTNNGLYRRIILWQEYENSYMKMKLLSFVPTIFFNLEKKHDFIPNTYINA